MVVFNAPWFDQLQAKQAEMRRAFEAQQAKAKLRRMSKRRAIELINVAIEERDRTKAVLQADFDARDAPSPEFINAYLLACSIADYKCELVYNATYDQWQADRVQKAVRP